MHRCGMWGWMLSYDRMIFSSLEIFHAVHDKPLEWWRKSAILMVSSCGKYAANTHSSASQKTACIVLWPEGILFCFLFLGNAIPWFVILFPAQSDDTSFCHLSSWCEAFDSIQFHQLWGNIFWLNFTLLCQRVRNPAGKNFLLSQTFHHLLHHMVPYSSLCCHFPNCCMSIPSGELTKFSFFLSVKKIQTGNKHRVDGQCLCSHL